MITYGDMGFTEFDLKLVNQIGEWNFRKLVNKVIDYKIEKGILQKGDLNGNRN